MGACEFLSSVGVVEVVVSRPQMIPSETPKKSSTQKIYWDSQSSSSLCFLKYYIVSSRPGICHLKSEVKQ